MLGYVAAVWLVAFVGGYLPYAVGTVGRKGESGTPWLSVMNVFSGGVFVAAGFMHLLPEAQVGLRALSSEWKFEWSFFFASFGFIIVFLLEELVEQMSSSHGPSPYACPSHDGYETHGEMSQAMSNSFNRLQNPSGEGCYKHGVGLAYGIGSARSFDDYSVDENHHIYGSDSESGFASPVTFLGGINRGGMRGNNRTGGLRNNNRCSTSDNNIKSRGDSRSTIPQIRAAQGVAEVGQSGTARQIVRSSSAGAVRSADVGMGGEGGQACTRLVVGSGEITDGYSDGGGSTMGPPTGGKITGDDGNTSATGNGNGTRNGNGNGKGKAGGRNYSALTSGDESWRSWPMDGRDVHLASLRGDGPQRQGPKRLGTRGTYGALSQSPGSDGSSGFWARAGGVFGGGKRGSGDLERGGASTDGDAVSPNKPGQGPWIGQRFDLSESAPLAATREQEDSLSDTVAGALADKRRPASPGPNNGGFSTHVDKHPNTSSGYSSNVGVILGAVLSFHALMEGLGLGASSASAAPGIFAAIVVHKGLAAFSLGCIFYSSDAPRLQYFLFMGMFSLLTPLGAGLGMVIRANFGGSTGAGICTALGAGTFLHVAAMEVLPRDLLHDSRMKRTKMACLVGGYLTFAGLSRYV